MKKMHIIILAFLCVLVLVMFMLILTLGRPGTSEQGPEVEPETPELIERKVGMSARYSAFTTIPQIKAPWATLSDGGPEVALGTWLSAVSARVEPRIAELLRQDMWKVYRCSDQSDVPGARLVLSMTFALQPNRPPLEFYQSQLAYISAWEQTLVNDMQPVLFPELKDDITITHDGTFAPTPGYEYAGMRQTSVRVGQNTERTIGYAFVNDELMVGNDMACLKQVSEYLFTPGEGENLIEGL